MSVRLSNVSELVSIPAREVPDRRALVFEGQGWTFRELDEAIGRFAAALAGLGLPRGSVVSIFLESVPELLVSYLGTVRAGHVANIVNGTLKGREAHFILKDSDTRLLVTDGERWQMVAGEGEPLPLLQTVVLVPGPGGEGGPLHAAGGVGDVSTGSFANFTDPAKVGAGPNVQVETEENQLSTLMYTSGTTGSPKGVMLSHRNIIDNATRFAAIHYSPEDRLAIGAPLFHCWGLINGLLGILWARGTGMVLRRFQTEPALQLVAGEKATQFLGVAAMYRFMLRAPGAREALASLRCVHSAAAPTPVELIERLRNDFGIQYAESYGLTETSPVITTTHYRDTRPGSCGRAMGDTLLKVVDPSGNVQPPGGVGELWAKGTAIMLGYWRRPEATAAAITEDGWFKTGDIVKMDGDGYVYIVDRAKDMINVAGEKVYPREVEEVLHLHPGVADATVVGIPHPDKGEVPKAYVVPKAAGPGAAGANAAGPVTAEEIIAFCKERLARFKVPVEVEFVDAIPRSASGKVLRRLLRTS